MIKRDLTLYQYKLMHPIPHGDPPDILKDFDAEKVAAFKEIEAKCLAKIAKLNQQMYEAFEKILE